MLWDYDDPQESASTAWGQRLTNAAPQRTQTSIQAPAGGCRQVREHAWRWLRCGSLRPPCLRGVQERLRLRRSHYLTMALTRTFTSPSVNTQARLGTHAAHLSAARVMLHEASRRHLLTRQSRGHC